MFNKKLSLLATVILGVGSIGGTPAIADTSSTLDSIQVSGSIDKLGAYSSANTLATISQEDLNRFNSTKISQAMTYTSGVNANYADSRYPLYKVRGLTTQTTFDGSETAGGVFRPKTFAVERVEILKGANSILQGSTEAGGAVNIIVKKPKPLNFGLLKLSLGNWSHSGIGLDLNRVVTPEVAFRVVSFANKTDGFKKTTHLNDKYIAPSLTWKITPNTDLTLLASYYNEAGKSWEFIVPSFGAAFSPTGQWIEPDTYYGTDKAYYQYSELTLGFDLSHKFNDTTKLIQSGRFIKHNLDYVTAAAGMAMYMPTLKKATAMRQMTGSKGISKRFSLDQRIEHNFKLADNIENIVTLGLAYVRNFDITQSSEGGTAASVDLFNPNGSSDKMPTGWGKESYDLYKQTSVYLLNSFQLNRQLFVNLGLRWNKLSGYKDNAVGRSDLDFSKIAKSFGVTYKSAIGLSPYFSYSESFKYQTNFLAAARGAMPGGHPGSTSGSASSSARPGSQGGSGTASTGTGGAPGAGSSHSSAASSAGRPASTFGHNATSSTPNLPNTAKQFTIGTRYEPEFIDGYLDIAYFNIESKNSYKRSGTGQYPMQKSRGFEVQLTANPVDFWKVNLAYTYTNVTSYNKYEGKGSKANVAYEEPISPRHLFAFYNSFRLAALNNTTIGLGMRYVGSTLFRNLAYMEMNMPAMSAMRPSTSSSAAHGAAVGGAGVPGAAAAAASARPAYKTVPEFRGQAVWLFDLNVNIPITSKVNLNLSGTNLFNKKYLTGCNSVCYFGEGRVLRADLSYNF